MKMYLISDNIDTLTGMRLAGVEGEVVHGRREAKQAVEKILEDKDLGILLLTEKLSFEIPELVDDIKLNRKQPLLVEVPDPATVQDVNQISLLITLMKQLA